MDDNVGAFIPGRLATLGPSGEGPLTGLTLAVKDLFDVAPFPTTYGHPDWASTHPPVVGSSPLVLALLEAGARMVGKTKTVELAFGLTGENVWHGTPLNPRAPDRFPGGSSCGSAAAVAAGLTDLALGSDTGGSVRIPASYCGLFGIRPTHGVLSLAGAAALAPSFDTPGWFTRSPKLLEVVGDVLLAPNLGRVGRPLLWIEEAWDNADGAVVDVLAPLVAQLAPEFGEAVRVRLLPEGLPLVASYFRAVQMQEIWATLGGWVTAVRPTFGPGVAERFEAAAATPPGEAAGGRAFRRTLRARVRPLLEGGAVMVYPTSPCPAPPLDSTRLEQDRVRMTTLGVTAIAGFCGLPEVTLPLGEVRVDDNRSLPVGLSLVGAAGSDLPLLRLAREIAAVLGVP